MALINVEARLTGSSEAKAAPIRQISVTAVLRGVSASASGGRPSPEPQTPPKQGT
jgi:hypothetical protein